VALAITGVALTFLCNMYFAQAPTLGDQANTAIFNGRKDLLMIALGFLGTVTGYYLGRVPAERQADAARNAATKAEQSEAMVKQQVLNSAPKLRAAARDGGAAGGGGAAGRATN